MRLAAALVAVVLVAQPPASRPDATRTPGTAYPAVTRRQLCTVGYTSTVRNVPPSVARQVFAAYGIPYADKSAYELDHLVSLQLGGNNDPRNLWPEPITEARRKDVVERALNRELCAGNASISGVQRRIRAWWTEPTYTPPTR